MAKIERIKNTPTIMVVYPEANYPLSIEWHRLTNFKYLDNIKEHYPTIYQDWKTKGWLPFRKMD